MAGDTVTFDVEESRMKPGEMQAANVSGGTGKPPKRGGGVNQGTVKSFVADKGWGFIVGPDGADIFFHQRGVSDGSTPQKGDYVSYDLEESSQKPGQICAVNITGGTGYGKGKGDKGGGKGGGKDGWGGDGGYGAAKGGWGGDGGWGGGGKGGKDGWGPYDGGKGKEGGWDGGKGKGKEGGWGGGGDGWGKGGGGDSWGKGGGGGDGWGKGGGDSWGGKGDSWGGSKGGW